MAKVMFARLCREIKKNRQSGLYSLAGSFAHLRWRQGPVGFVCVVYWEKVDETFRLSFALIDEAGTLLDETPATECVLTGQRENISTAFFYASFPRTGVYTIAVYKNGICIETIPLEVRENQHSRQHPMVPFVPLESGVSG